MSSPTNRRFEVFGEYVLLKALASGGMAEVFLARPAKPGGNGRILVIKRILREIANDPVFIKMFRSEIHTTLGFNHPHTIQLHDFGEIEGQPYIAMEFVEGKSLREVTAKFGEKGEPIPVPTVLGLMAQAAAGLAYAHAFENVATGEAVKAVHRDISPHNLIVSYSGNLKVIDFGIAKAKNGIAEKTRAGQIKGKCGYLSPEQLAEDDLDGRSDIFSLGIVTWELLTSQKLFQKQGDTELQIIKRIEKCEEHIVPPSTLNPEISPEVDEVVLKALQKNPDDRYPSASAYQAALRAVMQKKYPHYAYGDTSQIMHALFETDMMLERMELRELNDTAQQVLSAEWEAKTAIVEKEKPQGLLSSLFRGFGRNKKELPDLVELRVSKLETMLTQKAGMKHMALFAFYLLSIVGIKLDERYSLLDRFFLPAQAEMIAAAESVRPVTHRRTGVDTVARQTAADHLAEINPSSGDPEDAPEAPTANPAAYHEPAPTSVREAAPAPIVRHAAPAPAPVAKTVPATVQHHAAPAKVARKSVPAAPRRPALKPTAKTGTRTAAKSVAPAAKPRITSHAKKTIPTRSIATTKSVAPKSKKTTDTSRQ